MQKSAMVASLACHVVEKPEYGLLVLLESVEDMRLTAGSLASRAVRIPHL